MVSKKYAVALNLTAAAVDDPDSMLKENYACGSENNFAKYCNPAVEELLDRQSQEADAGKRRALVWEIERRLAEDVANPVILHIVGYGCRHPHFKGAVLQQNSIYNRWRLEDVWLDR
jgi:peptide/nickel transport system substrate-binding protein